MLGLAELAELASAHGAALQHPVAPLVVAGLAYDLDANPAVMGVVNLSRDSTYRDSVAVTNPSALRRARIMTAQGAAFVDLGAEASTAHAARVGGSDQRGRLVPVIRDLVAAGVTVSVETYQAEVATAALGAGAAIVNLTGSREEVEIYDLAAAHSAAVIVCFSPGADVREIRDFPQATDPIPLLLDHLGQRLELARSRGVTELAIDPGIGFFYRNLTDPLTRVRAQTRVLLQSLRLRVLGVPVCQALPHAFDLFEEEYRSAEAFFAVVSALARNNIYRTHETSQVTAVLRALRALS